MLGISVSKFHKLVPVVKNKDPHRLHDRLEHIPSESHLQNSTRYTTLLWDRTDIFNDIWQADGDRATLSKSQGWGNIPIFHHM